uniref:Uncharacterized protein n=1 Tax=Zea mays TaxID=4577 RepID=C0PGS9_MAIZE|nr:unknown [Zea mays]
MQDNKHNKHKSSQTILLLHQVERYRTIITHNLKHDRGGGVRMNCEQADALQRPLECHLIFPLLPSDLAGLGLPHDLDGGLLGVLALPGSRLGPVHSGQHDGVALRPPRGAVGAVERVPGAGERPELVRIPPIRAATSLHHPLPLRSGCPRRRRRRREKPDRR